MRRKALASQVSFKRHLNHSPFFLVFCYLMLQFVLLMIMITIIMIMKRMTMKTKRMLIMPGILYAMSYINGWTKFRICWNGNKNLGMYFPYPCYCISSFHSSFLLRKNTFFGTIHAINGIYTEMHYNKL